MVRKTGMLLNFKLNQLPISNSRSSKYTVFCGFENIGSWRTKSDKITKQGN